MQDFRKLRVWDSARSYCVAVYRGTRDFPADERFGMTAQLRRAAVSICANIAEGCGYLGKRDSARFFQMALASSMECLNHMILSQDLGWLGGETFDELESQLIVVRKQLVRLLQRVRSDVSRRPGTTSASGFHQKLKAES